MASEPDSVQAALRPLRRGFRLYRETFAAVLLSVSSREEMGPALIELFRNFSF
jgi:hypothetical protein